MLRRQLKDLDLEYERLEILWQSQPGLETAVATLRWCKRNRDMFDSHDGSYSDRTGYISERLALEPMVCRVDVTWQNGKTVFVFGDIVSNYDSITISAR